MNEKIKCKEVKVSKSLEMNDCDYLLDVLETIKNMQVNVSIALNEASNEELYKKFLAFNDEISFMQRELYELAFNKGWYILECAKDKKINEASTKLGKKLEELI